VSEWSEKARRAEGRAVNITEQRRGKARGSRQRPLAVAVTHSRNGKREIDESSGVEIKRGESNKTQIECMKSNGNGTR